MKTKILFFAVLMMLVMGINAQPVTRNHRSFGGMNMMRQDSTFKGGMRSNPGSQPWGNQSGMMRGLGLNDAQIKAFKDIHIAMYKEVKPLKNKLMEATVHQKALLSADEPAMKAINENIDKIGGIKVEIQKVQTKYLLEMRSKLSDEQRMKLEMMKSHRGKGAGMGMNNRPMREGFKGPGAGRNFGSGFDF